MQFMLTLLSDGAELSQQIISALSDTDAETRAKSIAVNVQEKVKGFSNSIISYKTPVLIKAWNYGTPIY